MQLWIDFLKFCVVLNCLFLWNKCEAYRPYSVSRKAAHIFTLPQLVTDTNLETSTKTIKLAEKGQEGGQECDLASEGSVSCKAEVQKSPSTVWSTFGELAHKTSAVNLGQV